MNSGGPPVLFALLLVVSSAGCTNDMLWAVGQTEKLGLVTSFSLQDHRVEALSATLEAPVQMVRPENRFRIDPIPMDLFPANRDWKALVVLTDVSQPGALGEVVDHLLSTEEQEELSRSAADYRLLENVWARGQCVLLVHAKDPAGIDAFLAQRGAAMARNFDESLQAAIAPAVLAAGQDEDMREYLRSTYGFEIGIPKGYSTGEDGEGRVVRIYRTVPGEPARLLLIHWTPLADRPRTLEEFVALRDRIGGIYYQGDYVLEERSRVFEGSFQGEPAWVIEGVWQNDGFVIGGPFRSFGFVRGDRFFLLDVAVFNPPGSKLPYLRETLAIAQTFRVLEPS